MDSLVVYYALAVAIAILLVDSARQLGASCEVRFEIRDAWVGLFWTVVHVVEYEEPGEIPTEVLVEGLRVGPRELRFYVCPIPFIALQFSITMKRKDPKC